MQWACVNDADVEKCELWHVNHCSKGTVSELFTCYFNFIFCLTSHVQWTRRHHSPQLTHLLMYVTSLNVLAVPILKSIEWHHAPLSGWASIWSCTLVLSTQALYEAGEKKWGTDEDKFIDILCHRSVPQLRQSEYTLPSTTFFLIFYFFYYYYYANALCVMFWQLWLNTRVLARRLCRRALRVRCLETWRSCWWLLVRKKYSNLLCYDFIVTWHTI